MNIPKVLIVCEHASSKFGGEAMLPLNYFLLLSNKLPQVFLLTHARTRKDLETVPGINLDRIFYTPDTWAHKIFNVIGGKLPDRIASITFGALSHLLTQYFQWKMTRKLVREFSIDIVHEPAPVSPKQPSMMFAVGAPVIIGPMNGGMSFPPAFAYMSGPFERWLYSVLRFFSSLYNVLIPGKLFSSVLLVANKRTKEALPFFRFGKIIELVENGVFASKVRHDAKVVGSAESINVVYVGRLVDWKTIDIVIDAVAMCRSQNVKFIIVGDGSERNRLEKHAASVAPDKVSFLGAVPHAQILNCYDMADIFVLPSIRECGGAVVLEAMARGIPVIATNWGGRRIM